jgi:SAM-dependent methyltransferase
VSDWIWLAGATLTAALVGLAAFLFAVTRGALLVRAATGSGAGPAAHVYPIYSSRALIRAIDWQPVISAILLCQYARLVSVITAGLRATDLRGRDVLITSCAFGNVIPRVVGAAIDAGARRVLIADLVRHELEHAQGKLGAFGERTRLLEQDATAMPMGDGSVAANVMFFLLHELPDPQKLVALREATRLLEPGGRLYVAEFHRPRPFVLRALSWTYFKTFEPWGLALWDTHDPVRQLEALGGVRCERRTFFFDNFQVVTVTRAGEPIARHQPGNTPDAVGATPCSRRRA